VTHVKRGGRLVRIKRRYNGGAMGRGVRFWLPVHILHIEDDPRDAELIARRLRLDGMDCEIVWARDELETRSSLELGEFDVILSDFAIPGFGGLSALRLAKERRPKVPFLFVSGTIGETRAIESLRAGAADYLLKDRLDRLPAAIRGAVEASRIEAERCRAVAALRESEERFRQVTENIEEVFWLAQLGPRRIIYVSPAYERIWGRPCAQLEINPNAWLDAVHPDDRDRTAEAMGLQATSGYDVEYRIVRPDGSVRWIHARAFPVEDKNGQTYRIAGIAQDITAHRGLEEEVRQANKMEALGQFAGGIAHDFNNILAVIQIQAHVLLTDTHLRPRQTAGLESIASATASAAKLTRQLLAFGRPEPAQIRDIDLVQVVAETVKLVRRLIPVTIAIETEFAAGLPPIRIDPAMVEQVVMNLTVNARDAMPEGGCLRLSLDLIDADVAEVALHPGVRPGRFLRLKVADTGCGIARENLSRVFEPFFTTKKPGEGTGLGLATVSRIVAQCHGWIEIDSEFGRGTEFSIHLPAQLPTHLEK